MAKKSEIATNAQVGPPNAVRTVAEELIAPQMAFGKYVLEHQVHESRVSEVWLARRTDLVFQRKKIAIRFASRLGDVGWTSFAEQQIYLERELLGGCNSPHVPELLDVGRTPDGRVYNVLQYRGDDLEIGEFIRSRRLSLADALRLFCVLCEAFDSIHNKTCFLCGPGAAINARFVAHTKPPLVQVIDFDFATSVFDGSGALNKLERWPEIAVGYTAPELRLTNGPFNRTTDIYSLGSKLFCMISGAPPLELATGVGKGMDDESRRELLRTSRIPSLSTAIESRPDGISISLSPYQSLDKLLFVIEKFVDPLVARSLAPDPSDRQHDCSQLVAEVTAVIHSLTSSRSRLQLPFDCESYDGKAQKEVEIDNNVVDIYLNNMSDDFASPADTKRVNTVRVIAEQFEIPLTADFFKHIAVSHRPDAVEDSTGVGLAIAFESFCAEFVTAQKLGELSQLSERIARCVVRIDGGDASDPRNRAYRNAIATLESKVDEMRSLWIEEKTDASVAGVPSRNRTDRGSLGR